MLVGQTAINFAANVISAAFGLINVVIFTRLFAPAEFGTYVLGVGFGTIATTFMSHVAAASHHAGAGARRRHRHPRHHRCRGCCFRACSAPLTYLGAMLAGLASGPALAAAGLAVAVGFFETGQELLRARLQAFTVMKATVVRAVMVSALGVAVAVAGQTGVLLLISSALAYLLAAWIFTRDVWGGAVVRFDGARLLDLAKAGIPLTASLTLLALSSVIDRFIIAHLIGPGCRRPVQRRRRPGSAGADHSGGQRGGRLHARSRCRSTPIKGAKPPGPISTSAFEFLLAIMLPACVGFAVVSTHIANVVLGPDFRSMAAAVMPIVSVAVIFQIMSYQYLHISFLLSERNAFYLLNTGSVLAVNLVVSYVLIRALRRGRRGLGTAGGGNVRLLQRADADALGVPDAGALLRHDAGADRHAIVMAIVVRSLELTLRWTTRMRSPCCCPPGSSAI